MNNISKLLILERLHKLIKQQYKGSADEYAARLNISRATLFNHINDLKYFGAKIMYNRFINSFEYLNDFTFEIIIKAESLSNEQMNNIQGGKSFVQSNFLDGGNLFLYLNKKLIN